MSFTISLIFTESNQPLISALRTIYLENMSYLTTVVYGNNINYHNILQKSSDSFQADFNIPLFSKSFSTFVPSYIILSFKASWSNWASNLCFDHCHLQYDQIIKVDMVNVPKPICCDNIGFDVFINAAKPTPTPDEMPYKKLSRKQGILETSLPNITRPWNKSTITIE